MLQSNFSESGSRASNDIMNKIKQLLKHQRLAVTRVSSIGINRDEAKEMHARIDEVLELLDQLHDLK